jgi:hypothetical protein
MANKLDQPATQRLGLLGLGATRRWDVAVDESPDGNGWSLELDGRQAYLVFRLQDLNVLPAALSYLQAAVNAQDTGGNNGLVLGRFGSSSVSLMWDNEDPLRCFLLVGPESDATLRLSFDGEDIRMLVEALRQIVADLPKPASDANGPRRL